MRLRAIVPLFLSLVAVAAACGKDATQPTGAPSTVSFTYSGDRNGTYSATGFEPDVRTGTRWTTPWASATNLNGTTQAYTEVLTSLPVSTGNQVTLFFFPYGKTGTSALSAAQGDQVVFDYKSGVSGGQVYFFNPGTVSVTSVTADRVAGTFSGTAVDTVNHRTLTVTNGSFDVHVNNP
jgi:hypothetical protein